MHDLMAVLSGAAKYIGGIVILFGGVWLFFNINQQNRITGPILMMAAGGLITSLVPLFVGETGW